MIRTLPIGIAFASRFLLASFFFYSTLTPALAADDPSTGGIGATEAPIASASAEGWANDSEVTEVGKSAIRAQDLLKVQLENSQNDISSIAEVANTVRNIAYVLFLLVLLGGGILLMITRGRNIKLLRFLPYSLLMLVWITFSFPVTEFVYRATDALTLNFMKGVQRDNLYLIKFNANYQFKGYRRQGDEYNEAAKTNLTLVRLTTFTYNVMTMVLIARKIGMLFLIIVSPLIALLLPFPLIKNTAKIWIGVFFQFLFYWPLFAIFLWATTKIWQSGIPLNFTGGAQDLVKYPTATSILIAGPGVAAGLAQNANNPHTYTLYLVGLAMLWTSLILPFLLLRIFRDVSGEGGKEDKSASSFRALTNALLGRNQPPPQPIAPAGAGQAKALANASVSLPFARSVSTANIQANNVNIEANIPKLNTNDILKIAGINIPTLRDLANYDLSRTSARAGQQNLASTPTSKLASNLAQLSTPNQAATESDRKRLSTIRRELESRATSGDRQADAVLKAAQTAGVAAGVASAQTASHVAGRAIKSGQNVAGRPTVSPIVPSVNKVQTVSIDDYEQVKKMWSQNYQTADIPQSEKVKSRQDWVKGDIAKLESLISMMSSLNPETRKDALGEVSALLPFILLGGFSETEITAYLRAKLEGAKEVLVDLEKQKEKETLVEVEAKTEEVKPKTLAQEMAEDIPGNISENKFTKLEGKETPLETKPEAPKPPEPELK